MASALVTFVWHMIFSVENNVGQINFVHDYRDDHFVILQRYTFVGENRSRKRTVDLIRSDQFKWASNNDVSTSSIGNKANIDISIWLKNHKNYHLALCIYVLHRRRILCMLWCCLVPFEQIICMFEASKRWYLYGTWKSRKPSDVVIAFFKSHAHE